MTNTIENLVKKLQEIPIDEKFVSKHKRRPEDFTRKRNLSFAEMLHFVICNLGTSFDFEVLNFIAARGETVSAAAVSKCRDKINSDAFKELLEESAKEVPLKHVYKGYRLIAYDGMKGELPRTQELLKLCNTPERNSYPEFHALAEYDVLNCCYTNAEIYFGTTDERKAAKRLIDAHVSDVDTIFLLDRGFPSLEVILSLLASKKNFVMRVSKSFLKEVNEFTKSNKNDQIVQVICDKRRIATSRIKDAIPCDFALRCVKIELASGETEILVTNLDKDEFSRKDIGELYNLRWKIETGFLHLKYAIRIEDFIGQKKNSISQEFFASLIKSNLVMQFVEVSDTIIHNKKTQNTSTKPTFEKPLA
jgi:hypothetical protein